jgi:hypothetical protein
LEEGITDGVANVALGVAVDAVEAETVGVVVEVA